MDVNNNVDKIITALYLAQSDNRELMLADLIKNVLYTQNVPLKTESICSYIIENFHLDPIKYEVINTLNILLDKGEVHFYSPFYTLAEDAKQKIFQSTLKTKEDSNRRFLQFEVLIKKLYPDELANDEIQILWQVFNEYLLECFMEFGRKAIDIFLPYINTSITEDQNIHKDACKKLNSNKLEKIFKGLILQYPNLLSDVELRYLMSLSTRAERFYSLGIEKHEYQKIKSLEIKDLVVVLDTNVLYSILNLRHHNEDPAIEEILKLARTQVIDLRLKYIRKSYSELHRVKQHIDLIVPKVQFRPTHIRSMLATGKIDTFAREYYEGKLANSDFPHPSDKITYASDLFKSKGIMLYNHPFPHIDADEQHLNKLVSYYYDFEREFNHRAELRGLKYKLNKTDINKEHDVYLREAIVTLKEKYTKENELKFICITLDNSLINFDHFLFRKAGLKPKEVINPNFMSPSVFLKKIRPFIPISTNDYRKAFISSLTASTYDLEDKDKSTAIIKSMTYFKNMGIDDEEVLMSCIRRELFVEEVSHLDNPVEIEQFILSEVGKEIENVRKEKNQIINDSKLAIDEKEKAIQKNEVEKQEALKNLSQENKTILLRTKEESLKELERLEHEKQRLLEEETARVFELKGQLSIKEEAIEDLSKRIDSFLLIQEELKSKLNEQHIDQQLVLKSDEWETMKANTLNTSWKQRKLKLQMDIVYMGSTLILTILPSLAFVLIKINEELIKTWLLEEDMNIHLIWVYGGLLVIQVVELYARSYLINKDKVKSGWQYFWAILSVKAYRKLRQNELNTAENEFLLSNPKPTRENIISN